MFLPSASVEEFVLGVTNGGTGQITANAAFNALIPSQDTHAGKFLTTNGTDTSWAAVSGTLSGGEINRIPKWTSATTQGNSQLFDTGTFVGVGISNPAHKLDIDSPGAGIISTQRLQNTITAANDTGAQLLFAANRTAGLINVAGVAGVITDITNAAYKGALIFSTANNAEPIERMRIDHLGNVRIGLLPTDVASGKFHIRSDASVITPVFFERISIPQDPLADNSSSPMFIVKSKSTGNMTDAFGSRISFSIQDNTSAEHEVASIVGYMRGGTDNSGSLGLYTSLLGVSTEVMTIDTSGRVSIGAVNQSVTTAQFHVLTSSFNLQSLRIDGSANNNSFVVYNDGKASFGSAPASGLLGFSQAIITKSQNSGTNLVVNNPSGGSSALAYLYAINDLQSGISMQVLSSTFAPIIGDLFLPNIGRIATDNAITNGIAITTANPVAPIKFGINHFEKWRITPAGNLTNTLTDATTLFHIKGAAAQNVFRADSNTVNNIFSVDMNGNIQVNGLHNNLTAQGNATNQHIRSGDFMPVYAIVANLTSVTGTVVQWKRVGNVVTVSGRFTAAQTLAATATSFTITLPVAPGFSAVHQLAGTAFSGEITGLGAEIIADVAGNKAKVQWISSGSTTQTFSFHFTYQIVSAGA